MNVKRGFLAFCACVLLAGSTAWASGKIMRIEKETAQLELKTWLIVGNKYQLQCSTNLVSGIWTDVGEQFTAGLTSTNLTVEAEAARCWFRVVQEKGTQEGPTSPPEAPPAEFKMPPSSPPPSA